MRPFWGRDLLYCGSPDKAMTGGLRMCCLRSVSGLQLSPLYRQIRALFNGELRHTTPHLLPMHLYFHYVALGQPIVIVIAYRYTSRLFGAILLGPSATLRHHQCTKYTYLALSHHCHDAYQDSCRVHILRHAHKLSLVHQMSHLQASCPSFRTNSEAWTLVSVGR
ncbi:hypothetical protein B0H11DRAFT_2066058 [Mycena galericulata]|nr:hypothetical protein B0H11DRAFT_2066058 [Mycena galericulata]